MKIGIAAATLFEIEPTIKFLSLPSALKLNHKFEICITGIGSLVCAYQLTSFILKQSPDLVIQAGIGGSFTEDFPPGKIVMIREEILGDLGAEENNLFNDLFDLGLVEPAVRPYSKGRLINPHLANWEKYKIPFATGITVNEITTQRQRIEQLAEKYHCDIESMEGAAFHYVCLQEGIPFIQLRSVSNYIGVRDKNKWKLKESVDHLNQTLINIIQQIP